MDYKKHFCNCSKYNDCAVHRLISIYLAVQLKVDEQRKEDLNVCRILMIMIMFSKEIPSGLGQLQQQVGHKLMQFRHLVAHLDLGLAGESHLQGCVIHPILQYFLSQRIVHRKQELICLLNTTYCLILQLTGNVLEYPYGTALKRKNANAGEKQII